jgi:hypothetical protein
MKAAGFFTPGKPEDYRFCGVIITNAFNWSTVLVFRTGRKMTPSHAISLGSVLILSSHKKLATLMFYSHSIHNKKGTHFLVSLFILMPCPFHLFSSNSQKAQALNYFVV